MEQLSPTSTENTTDDTDIRYLQCALQHSKFNCDDNQEKQDLNATSLGKQSYCS